MYYFKQDKLSTKLKNNSNVINENLKGNVDFVSRELLVKSSQSKIEFMICYINGLVDKNCVNEYMIKPVLSCDLKEDSLYKNEFEYFKNKLVQVGEIEEIEKVSEVIQNILSGNTVLLIDTSSRAIVVKNTLYNMRSVGEPKTESVVRGSHEGFCESLMINISLIRRRIKSEELLFKSLIIGKVTRTNVCMVYLKNKASEELVAEVEQRLNKIDVESILESGYIEQFIEDNPYSIFSTVGNTEKPDALVAKILEGRIGILTDGTPFVLTVPLLMVESFQTSEDYYCRPFYSNFVRIIRYISFGLSVLSPALYVALTTFHQELIPTPLLITMISAKEGTPFPAVIEAIGMSIVYEILREAGIRLPIPIGPAISIVGALVLGQAAVSAGLIGAPMVIVVAITAIASFVVPPQTDSGTMLRFVLIILAGALGGFGIMIGLMVVIIHLCSLNSFGVPYLSPLAPYRYSNFQDIFIRHDLRNIFSRSNNISDNHKKRY